jgi:hypothetical protein
MMHTYMHTYMPDEHLVKSACTPKPHSDAHPPLYTQTYTFNPHTRINARVHTQENPVPNIRTDAVKTMLAACFLALLMAPPHVSISCSVVVRDSE